MTNASSTAKPVPVTPNTPAARSESVKNPPAGAANRRTSSISVTDTATAAAMIASTTSGFMMRAAGWRDASAT
jgi:hypothetical protein